jgi:thioredoxin reductase
MDDSTAITLKPELVEELMRAAKSPGSFYKIDPRTKETRVSGVYAAGDAAQALHSVTFAMADGARAGASAHQSLVFGQEPVAANAHAAASR